MFPAKILVATDGSEEANLAASTATELAKSTNSELHAVCAKHTPAVYYELPGTVVDPTLQSRLEEDPEEPRARTPKEGLDGQRVGLCGQARPLSRTRGAPEALTYLSRPALPPPLERPIHLPALLRRQARALRQEGRLPHQRGREGPFRPGRARPRARGGEHRRGELRSRGHKRSGRVRGRGGRRLAGKGASDWLSPDA